MATVTRYNDPRFIVDWIDNDGKQPQMPSNEAFPDGVAIDLVKHTKGQPKVDAQDPKPEPDEPASCWVLLPYPVPNLGWFYVECKTCHTNVLITTAGRPDDPRTLRVPCKAPGAEFDASISETEITKAARRDVRGRRGP